MKRLLQLLVVCAAYFVIPAASASLLGCFECTDAQSKSAAITEYNDSGKNEAFIEVVDFKNNIVRSYRIEYDPEFRQTMVMKVTSTSYAKSKSAELTQEYETLQSTMASVNHVSTEYDSAYTVVRDNKYLSVTNEYMAQTDAIERFGAYAGLVAASLGKMVVSVNVVIEIGFPDGSKIKFKVTGIDVDHNIVFEVKEASDSENNEIPLNKNNVTGRYQFSVEYENWRKFENLASEGYGISLSDWASLFENEVNGTPTVIVCDSTEGCKTVN